MEMVVGCGGRAEIYNRPIVKYGNLKGMLQQTHCAAALLILFTLYHYDGLEPPPPTLVLSPTPFCCSQSHTVHQSMHKIYSMMKFFLVI